MRLSASTTSPLGRQGNRDPLPGAVAGTAREGECRFAEAMSGHRPARHPVCHQNTRRNRIAYHLNVYGGRELVHVQIGG